MVSVLKELSIDFYIGRRVSQIIVSRFVCSAEDVDIKVVFELVRLQVATKKSSDARLIPNQCKSVDLEIPLAASDHI